MANPHFLFAGGGTGGHLYPGLAVAEALLERAPGARVRFLTTDRALDRELLSRTPHAQTTQPVRPFTLHPLRAPAFLLAWRSSVSAARRLIRRERPRAVLGLGGYAAGPPVVAAWKEGVPAAILNPDAVPGKANRWLAPRAQRVFAQFDVSRRYFAASARIEVVGCPIRAGFRGVDAQEGRRAFGFSDDLSRPVLLVTGASQGAQTINRVMQHLWPALAEGRPEWQLLHLSGQVDEAETRSAYEAAGVHAVVLPFTHDMPKALAAADLVVSRAGASTLAELTALGKPSILLPYPYHRDRHQHANAEALVEAGAAELVEDQRDAAKTGPALADALERCMSPETRERMRLAARRLGKPDAAGAVVEWLLEC